MREKLSCEDYQAQVALSEEIIGEVLADEARQAKHFELTKAVVKAVLGDQVEVQQDDDMIRIGNVVGICETDVSNECLDTDRKWTTVGYQVVRFTYDPGVMYFPDGSGEPPSEDCDNVGEAHNRFEDALKAAIALHIESEVDDYLTARSEVEFEEDADV